jgi:hypothetical protein
MTKFFRIVTMACALSMFSGCVSLNTVSLTQIPAKRSKKVHGSSDKWLFFMIAFDSDYVDAAAADLKAKCPGGKISGILTKDVYTNYFLGIVMKRTINAEGYCSKA